MHQRLSVVTDLFHTRRAARTFRTLLPDTTIYLNAAPDPNYDASRWWQTEEGLVAVFNLDEHVPQAIQSQLLPPSPSSLPPTSSSTNAPSPSSWTLTPTTHMSWFVYVIRLALEIDRNAVKEKISENSCNSWQKPFGSGLSRLRNSGGLGF